MAVKNVHPSVPGRERATQCGQGSLRRNPKLSETSDFCARRVRATPILFLPLLFVAACGAGRDPCAGASGVPASECAALVAFYHSTGGPQWKDQRGWLEDDDACTWFGVSCAGGHVTGISINFNELRGSLPAELGALSHLRTLSLYYNHLQGGIPVELANLGNLEALILHNNELSGSIPPELGALSSLRNLDLDSNDLSGAIPPELGDLAALRELKLRDNRLSGEIPAELGDLSSLEGLYLSNNDLSGEIPGGLGRLTNLRLLSLYGNDLRGPLPAGLRAVPSSGYDLLWGDE